jgi:hypothetical protein
MTAAARTNTKLVLQQNAGTNKCRCRLNGDCVAYLCIIACRSRSAAPDELAPLLDVDILVDFR